MKLPPLKKQPSPQAVVDEHMDALNKCDWNRLMAQYPADYQLNLPDGVVIKGREAAAKIFADFVKPHDQGGLCGIKFSPEQTLVVGDLSTFDGRLRPISSLNHTKVPTPTRPTTG
jgi:ketosteroid isomerase-like protein